MSGGFGLVRQSREPDPGDQGVRSEGPDGHLQQCRRGRLRPVAPPADPPDPQDDLVLRRREQAVRAAISRRASWSSSSIRKALWPSGSGRAARASPPSTPAPASARSLPMAKPQEEFDGQLYVRETLASRRPRDHQGVAGRPRRQSPVPQDRAQLQSGDGDRGEVTVVEVEELVEVGAIDPDCVHTPGIYVASHRQKHDQRKAHREADGAGARI